MTPRWSLLRVVLRTWFGVLVLGFGLNNAVLSAADTQLKIKFVGMQGSKANISINRRMHLLKPGQSVKSVTLMSVNRTTAILRVDGANYRFARGRHGGTLLASTVVLPRDGAGMFIAKGEINGKPVNLIVDTGATYVAISAHQARRLGIRYRKNRPVKIRTASRVETAYLIDLESVRLGGIVKTAVPTVVMKGKQPSIVLLGMSFLRGLVITQTGDLLKIEQ